MLQIGKIKPIKSRYETDELKWAKKREVYMPVLAFFFETGEMGKIEFFGMFQHKQSFRLQQISLQDEDRQ